MTQEIDDFSLLKNYIDEKILKKIVTIELREFIREFQDEGLNITKKEALNSLKELEECGRMKIIKRIDKNRYKVELLNPNTQPTLPKKIKKIGWVLKPVTLGT